MWLLTGKMSTWAWTRYVSHLFAPYCAITAAGSAALFSAGRKAAFTLALLLQLASYAPGLYAWHRDAGVSRLGKIQIMAASLSQTRDNLDGIIMSLKGNRYCSYEPVGLGLYLHTEVPLYCLRWTDDGLRAERQYLVPSRYGLGRLNRRGDTTSQLPPGRYLLPDFGWRQRPPCETLAALQPPQTSLQEDHELTKQLGHTVCRVEKIINRETSLTQPEPLIPGPG